MLKYFPLFLFFVSSTVCSQTTSNGYPECPERDYHTYFYGYDLDGPDADGAFEAQYGRSLHGAGYSGQFCIDTVYDGAPAFCYYEFLEYLQNDPVDIWGEYAGCEHDITECDENYVGIWVTVELQRAYFANPEDHYFACSTYNLQPPTDRERIPEIAAGAIENYDTLQIEGQSEFRSMNQIEMNQSLDGLADRITKSHANSTSILSQEQNIANQRLDQINANTQTLGTIAYYQGLQIDELSKANDTLIRIEGELANNAGSGSGGTTNVTVDNTDVVNAIDSLKDDTPINAQSYEGSQLQADINDLEGTYSDELARFERVEEEGYLWGIQLPTFSVFNTLFPSSSSCQTITLNLYRSSTEFPNNDFCSASNIFKALLSFLLWGYLALQIKDDWVNMGGTR